MRCRSVCGLCFWGHAATGVNASAGGDARRSAAAMSEYLRVTNPAGIPHMGYPGRPWALCLFATLRSFNDACLLLCFRMRKAPGVPALPPLMQAAAQLALQAVRVRLRRVVQHRAR